MDWVSRLLGLPTTVKPPPPRAPANDPETRLARYKRVYHTILALCNRPRNLSTEGPLLDQLHACLDKLAVHIREEARSPAPHLCLQFSNANHVYALVGRAATVSQHEGIIFSAVGIFAALADSEEEDFLSSGPFAKSLMRMVGKVVENGTNAETETAILELLFTIAAKIRLQPEILGVWFQHRPKAPRDEGAPKEKPNFVGFAQKDDFPLCYLLIDRVHHEGRVGDFARTGLLYIFEATGRSQELETWILSSDLPTLMASGLGALYSQLSRELSLLHPDVTLPAVLAMSDYSTTHLRPTAESAFSERHKSHMAIFLSYLAFWQDVLDHCRSDDVRDTLLDHFQILFLQQLLYPSLLQSSDTDAGSSVAVLTYMTAMLESLDYPDLMHMMLAYLLAMSDNDLIMSPSASILSLSSSRTPRSPKALRRRQSLMLLTAPANPDDAVEPTLFNLVDLILNNVNSTNNQSVFASLKLISTIMSLQKRYAFGTLLRVDKQLNNETNRTIGALMLEVEKLTVIAASYHDDHDLDDAYVALCDDSRFAVESQVQSQAPDLAKSSHSLGEHIESLSVDRYALQESDPLLKTLSGLLRTFWTNSVDVNLALTQALVSIARCVEIKLNGWLTLDPSNYQYATDPPENSRSWHEYLTEEETKAFVSVQQASVQPVWPSNSHTPAIFGILEGLSHELNEVKQTCPNLDSLIAGRKNMLQASSVSIPPTPNVSEPPSRQPSPGPTSGPFLDVARPFSQTPSRSVSPQPRTPAEMLRSSSSRDVSGSPSPAPVFRSIFQPPPPDTPHTTDVLMQSLRFPSYTADREKESATGSDAVTDENDEDEQQQQQPQERTASLNHVLTNVVILQEFVLELAAVCQVRAAVLGDIEVKFVVD